MIIFLLFNLAIASFNGKHSAYGNEIELTFKNFTNSNEDLIDWDTVLPPNSVTEAVFTFIPQEIDFIIFQVHSFLHNVTLSYESILKPQKFVNGTNVGLFLRNDLTLSSKSFYIRNPFEFNIRALLVAVPYTDESPIPGGCNLEFPTEIAPYLNLHTSSQMITVDGSPASLPYLFNDCDMNPLAYVMFYKYLPRDFSVETYFESIRSMLTYPRILKNSYLAPEPIGGPPIRRSYNRYGGTGSVYALIVVNKYGNVAVYTPSFSRPDDLDSNDLSASLFLQIEFGILMLFSLLICFAGHRYFLGELFYMGGIAGGLISYIILMLQTTYSGDLLLMSTGIGIICGALWTSIWWCVNSPILSVILAFLNNGFLWSAVLYFLFIGDVAFFQNDMNYWLTFLIITFMITLLSTTNPVRYNIAACSAVSSYGVILPLDYLFGSNLKYIIINVIRRATVEGFNLVIGRPPFQFADNCMIALWALLVFFGVRCQKKLSAHRPPFPPVCIILRAEMPETTPILTNARFPSYTSA